MRVAVIGAGLAGLACARTFEDHGHHVAIFDKGRSPGGRATSRREPGGRTFDHGAQFFTARGDWLQRHLAPWERAGVVARWAPRVRAVTAARTGVDSSSGREGGETGGPAGRPRDVATWWVGTPRMGALAAHLAVGLDLRLGAVVSAVTRVDGVWRLAVAEGDATWVHHADALVVAVPAAQCSALLSPAIAAAPALARWSSILDPRAQTPCWAVMVALRSATDPGADVFEDTSGPVAWAAREGSKPGRAVPAGEELWTLHASTTWSQAHLEDAPESVATALAASFVAAHLPGASILHTRAHRWRYARGVAPGATGDVLFDAGSGLAVCGDWLVAPRVESALESGVAAADHILGAFATRR